MKNSWKRLKLQQKGSKNTDRSRLLSTHVEHEDSGGGGGGKKFS